MAVIHHRHPEGVESVATESTRTPGFRQALAALRIAFGVTFLWAFLDKTFALGFGTGYDQEGVLDRFGPAAWINGGSPTEGFLTFAVTEDNPFADLFHGLAGQAWVDWVFMLGLLGVGVTLLTGVAMRLGTAAGALMYAFMYAAVLPLETNPVVDVHLLGVITMAVLLLGHAGTTWGLGGTWRRTHLVERYPVLR